MSGKTLGNDTATLSQNALSFRITPKSTNKVVSSTPDNFNKKGYELNHSESEDKEYIIAAEGKELKSSIQQKDASKLVIPMIVKNKWLNEAADGEGDNLSQLAMNEILNDLNSEDESEVQDAASIPLMMKNRLPPSKDGIVMDERYDISIRPEESSIDDYKNIPVSSFGSAMLRGMGWNERQPIGGINKALCEPIEYIPRHKGLGLGAEKSGGKELHPRKRKLGDAAPDKKYKPIIEKDGRVRHIKKVGEEVPIHVEGFIPGYYVMILKKPHKGLYGKVISVDEDTARISVKLSLSGEVIQLSQYNAHIVDKIHTNTQRTDNSSCSNDLTNESQVGNYEEILLKQKNINENYSTSKGSKWMQPNIRVRIISRSFKGGKYYNKKAKILDVVSIDTCTCKTEENKILDNVHEKYLETVVPKTKGSYVMILLGKYKGKYAKLLDRKKVECLATVQLTSSKHITTESFDHIAEFTGELPEDEFL